MKAASIEVIAPPPRRGLARLRWHFAHRQSVFWLLGYSALVMVCLFSLWQNDDLSLGRRPWANLLTTIGEMSKPSFLDVWFGKTIEFKSDDGTVLRVENRQTAEVQYLHGLLSAVWMTIKIATLGSLLAALMGLPLGVLAASNMQVPRLLQMAARLILDTGRSIHTLVFALLLVGIIGLGPTAGILAIALHAMGTWGKLFAESIETLDMRPLEALRAAGASPIQVFWFGAWPALKPSVISNHLYLWEYNIRDSTVLGLIGAGGLGLLVTEAVSLFQWGRLSTVLIVIVVLVIAFDALSRRIRQSLL